MTKLISLTQGKSAIVDDEDFESLSKFKWHYRYMRSTHKHKGYAARSIRLPNEKVIRVFMHQQILKSPRVDHIDGDGLNNTRGNLRPCTQAENSRNKGDTRKPKTSRFRGVHFSGQLGKWEARICVNYRKIYLGIYTTEEEAALAYNAAAREHFGQFARLNEVTS